MSYALFLGLFLILPIIGLGYWTIRRRSKIPLSNKRIGYSLVSISSIAFIYTIPWDNYLVYRGIWWSPQDRIIGKVGFVPIEEYCFFILLPLMVSLLILVKLSYRKEILPSVRSGSDLLIVWPVRILLSALFGLGVFFLFLGEKHLYAGLLLSWATPIILGLTIWKSSVLYENAGTLLFSLTVSTIYFCLIDLLALNQGIWTIVEQYSLPLLLFGLPIEEALFYFLTSLLSCYGFLLFLNIWKLYNVDSNFKVN